MKKVSELAGAWRRRGSDGLTSGATPMYDHHMVSPA